MAGKKFTSATLITSTIVIMGFTAWSVYPYVTGNFTNLTTNQNASAQFAVFEVEGMTCGGCELAVNKSIEATGLVDSVKSSFTEGKIIVWYSGEEMDSVKILTAINNVGYKAKLDKTQTQSNIN